jgi:DNA-binding MarR family transcriptional regulator
LSEGREAELELQAFIPYQLSILANTVSRALAAHYTEEFDLTISQWRVMAVLGREGGLSANEGVGRTAMDKVSVSRAVSGLVRDARLLQIEDPDDARRRQLRLTSAGRAVYRRIVPRALEFERELVSALGIRDRGRLAGLLPGLQRAAEQVARKFDGQEET